VFILPLAIIESMSPRKPEFVGTFSGRQIIVFNSRYMYANTETGTVRSTDNFLHHYFIELYEDKYIGIAQTHHNGEEFMSLLATKKEQLTEMLEKAQWSYENQEAHYKEQRLILENKKIAREIELREKELKEELQKKKDEQLLAELLLAAKDDFLKDVPISFHYFEDLCKQNNIKIPIATLGMARKKVINLSVSQAKTWGKVDLSKLFGYAKLLKDCLVPASTNDNDISEAESNHLFGVK
jgi:hypothetical protein